LKMNRRRGGSRTKEGGGSEEAYKGTIFCLEKKGEKDSASKTCKTQQGRRKMGSKAGVRPVARRGKRRTEEDFVLKADEECSTRSASMQKSLAPEARGVLQGGGHARKLLRCNSGNPERRR